MNDQLPTDQRQLELVTSRKLSGSSVVDQGELATRESWLALGKAVESAGRKGLDEQALLVSLQNELLNSPPDSQAADQPQHADWSWAAVGVAAAVLIAATIVGAVSQRSANIPVPTPNFVFNH